MENRQLIKAQFLEFKKILERNLSRRSTRAVIDEKSEQEEEEQEEIEQGRSHKHRVVDKGNTMHLPPSMTNKQSPAKPRSDEKKRPPTPFFTLKAKNQLVEKRQSLNGMSEEGTMVSKKLQYYLPGSSSEETMCRRPVQQEKEGKAMKEQNMDLEHFDLKQEVQRLMDGHT